MGTVATQASISEKVPRFVSAGQVAIGWTAVLISSDLDAILGQVSGVTMLGWYPPVTKIVILVFLALLIKFLATDSYLWRFICALAALVAGDFVTTSVQGRVGWFQTAPHAHRMFVGVFLSFIPAGLGAFTLLNSGLTRRDLFLRIGDLRALTSLPLLRRVRWSLAAPTLLVLISSTLLIQLWIVSNASHHLQPKLFFVALFPAIVFAALNALSEEFRFRCLLLAHGSRFMGMAQAIAATSVLFGFAHFGGHPSGFSGVAMAAFFAWIVARSLVDTGGLGWAWSLHFIQDVMIFLMVAMAGA